MGRGASPPDKGHSDRVGGRDLRDEGLGGRVRRWRESWLESKPHARPGTKSHRFYAGIKITKVLGGETKTGPSVIDARGDA